MKKKDMSLDEKSVYWSLILFLRKRIRNSTSKSEQIKNVRNNGKRKMGNDVIGKL